MGLLVIITITIFPAYEIHDTMANVMLLMGDFNILVLNGLNLIMHLVQLGILILYKYVMQQMLFISRVLIMIHYSTKYQNEYLW